MKLALPIELNRPRAEAVPEALKPFLRALARALVADHLRRAAEGKKLPVAQERATARGP